MPAEVAARIDPPAGWAAGESARVLTQHGVRAGSAEVLYLDAEGRLTKPMRVECSEEDVAEAKTWLRGKGRMRAIGLPPGDRFRPRWTEK